MADSGLLSILILLGLSTVFNTISHQLFMDRLTSVGDCVNVYQWFAHYLADRTQFVQIQHYRSENSIVNHGVPQGSELGPLLSIGHTWQHFSALWYRNFHCFADETKLYVSTNATSTLTVILDSTLSFSSHINNVSWIAQDCALR